MHLNKPILYIIIRPLIYISKPDCNFDLSVNLAQKYLYYIQKM
jgi:hypothetical protein